MDSFILLVIGYAIFGAGLLWLSVRLARRIPSRAFRAAIHAAVFAFWFAPGAAAGEGGAMLVPLWMAFFGDLSRYQDIRAEEANYQQLDPMERGPAPVSLSPMQLWHRGLAEQLMIFAIVWLVAFLVILGLSAGWHWLRKRASANGPE